MHTSTATATTASPGCAPAIAAIAYAVAGWPVFPAHHPTADASCSCRHPDCASPSKHPRTEHGLRDATTNPAQIASWWARWPDANIAVCTGELVVLDADGLHGARALHALETAHEPLPPTRRARTGRGQHIYLLADGHEIRNSAGRLGEGLDVRGRGGYIIAPPSRHATRQRYTWANTHELAPIPHWLTELLTPAEPETERAPLSRALTEAGSDRARRYLHAALDGELAHVATAPIGTRNTALNRAAFRLGQLTGAGLGNDDQVAEALLHAAGCAGLGELEARTTIASGLRAGRSHPRPIPPSRR